MRPGDLAKTSGTVVWRSGRQSALFVLCGRGRQYRSRLMIFVMMPHPGKPALFCHVREISAAKDFLGSCKLAGLCKTSISS